MKSTSTVSNPLTIIAIFAGLAEIGGTGVLPFIEPDNQRLYIWFLMLFPSLLVTLFFCTLLYDNRVLYAPSDWENEENFFKDKFSKATATEGDQKLQDEIAETESIEADDLGAGAAGSSESGITNSPSSVEAPDKGKLNTLPEALGGSRIGGSRSEHMARYYWAELRGIAKLEQETGMDFKREVVFSRGRSGRMIFDGMSLVDSTAHVAEVKYFTRSASVIRPMLRKMLPKFQETASEFKTDGKALVLHLVVVTEGEIEKADVDRAVEKVLTDYGKLNFSLEVHHYRFEQLSLI